MKSLRATLAAVALVAASAFAPAMAAGGGAKPAELPWSFDGPFGQFDRAQLQRGFKVYRQVCASCHGISLIRFRNLAQPGGPEFTEAQVRNLAAEYKMQDGPNESGEMFERPGRPADAFPRPFPNEQAARAANNGAYPYDLSVMAHARFPKRGFPLFVVDIFTQYQEGGPDYIAAFLKGYVDPPADRAADIQPGQFWNTYKDGNIVSMPPVLQDGVVEYPKGPDGQPSAPETVRQYAMDVSAFLAWTADPHLEQRKRIGFQVMIFLAVFAGLLYYTKKKIWVSAKEGSANIAGSGTAS